MVTKAMIDDFISQHKLAIISVSPKANKFGNIAFKELKAKGYQLYLVYPSGEVIEGERSYASLKDLPDKGDVSWCPSHLPRLKRWCEKTMKRGFTVSGYSREQNPRLPSNIASKMG